MNPRRCGKCKKKINVCNSIKCSCGNSYCFYHKDPDDHNCDFLKQQKKIDKKRLEEQLVKTNDKKGLNNKI